MMKTMLMITGAPFLKAGNQSIRRTVSGLLDQNFKVLLWTIGSNDKPIVHRNLEYVCFKKMGKKIKKRDISDSKNDKFLECDFVEPNEIVDLSNDFNQWTRSVPALVYYYIRVYIHAIKNLKNLRKEVDYIWGYERAGVIISKLISKTLLKRPLITSYQGTALYGFLRKYGKKGTFKRLPVDYLSTKLKSDLVVMTDDGTKGDLVLKEMGHNEKTILYIPNGVDKTELEKVKILSKEELGLRDNDILCVLTARLERWKRVERAVLLMDELVKRGLRNYKLIIIGDGREKQCIETLYKEKDLTNEVEFWGWQPYDKAVELIRSSDMLWTFQDHSNLTNSVQDALAFNKIVVTINDGSIDNVLSNDSNAIMVELDDFLNDAASKISKLNYDKKKDIKEVSKNIFEWEDRIKCIVKEIDKI